MRPGPNPSTLAHDAQAHRKPRNPQTWRRLCRGNWGSPAARQAPNPVPTGPRLQSCSTEFQRKSKGLCPGYSLRVCNMVCLGQRGAPTPELRLLCLPPVKGELPGEPIPFPQRHDEEKKSFFHTHRDTRERGAFLMWKSRHIEMESLVGVMQTGGGKAETHTLALVLLAPCRHSLMRVSFLPR